MTFADKITELENTFRTLLDLESKLDLIEKFICSTNNDEWLNYAHSNDVYQCYKKDMIEYYKQQNKRIRLFYWLNAKKYERIFKFLFKIAGKPINELIYTDKPFQKSFNRIFFSLSENEISLFSQEDITKCREIFSLFVDEKSKLVFLYLLMAKITLKLSYFKAASEEKNGNTPQYFDNSIISCCDDEIFVDCGGFIGDTALIFYKNYRCKKYYFYEPDTANMEEAKKNLTKYDNIIYCPFGVSDNTDLMRFSAVKDSGSFFSEDGDIEVKVVALDEDISDEIVHFIKMDIEGYELKALIGAKGHITKEKPKLAICVYHKKTDLWEIASLIHSYNKDYKFYLRHYSCFCNETVLYCV